MIHPVTNRPEHKRSFIPSLVEKEKVSKLVHAIKMGWIKPRRVDDDSKGSYYDLWAGEDSSILAKHRMHLPAPKTPLPGHHESYNPPPEYLLTDEEVGGHGRPGASALSERDAPNHRAFISALVFDSTLKLARNFKDAVNSISLEKGNDTQVQRVCYCFGK